jgi:hypothetical protein
MAGNNQSFHQGIAPVARMKARPVDPPDTGYGPASVGYRQPVARNHDGRASA